MFKDYFNKVFYKSVGGLMLALVIGLIGYGINVITKDSLADPLLISMILGIIVATLVGKTSEYKKGFQIAPRLLIPIGVIFYAIKNLNFVKFAKVESSMIVLLFVIMGVYFSLIFFLGKIFNQKKEITYLVATGSAICGASAITITSPVVEAESDDISISLLAVAFAGLVGLLIILPFLGTLFNLTNNTYGLLASSVLQFTGFVKAAVEKVPFLTSVISPVELKAQALTFKSVRYLGLLLALPLFSSLVRKKIHIPWFLFAFLGAGIVGSVIYYFDKAFYTNTIIPLIKPIYNLSWSIAMAAVGLNADARQLLSNNGKKALIIAFLGFFAAILTFFVGIAIIRLF